MALLDMQRRARVYAAVFSSALVLATFVSCGPTINGEAVYSISGTITGAVRSGVTVTWTGGGDNGLPVTTTDASGKYSFHGLEPASYTVTPTVGTFSTTYVFTPPSRFIDVDSLVQGAVDEDFTSALRPTN